MLIIIITSTLLAVLFTWATVIQILYFQVYNNNRHHRYRVDHDIIVSKGATQTHPLPYADDRLVNVGASATLNQIAVVQDQVTQNIVSHPVNDRVLLRDVVFSQHDNNGEPQYYYLMASDHAGLQWSQSQSQLTLHSIDVSEQLRTVRMRFTLDTNTPHMMLETATQAGALLSSEHLLQYARVSDNRLYTLRLPDSTQLSAEHVPCIHDKCISAVVSDITGDRTLCIWGLDVVSVAPLIQVHVDISDNVINQCGNSSTVDLVYVNNMQKVCTLNLGGSINHNILDMVIPSNEKWILSVCTKHIYATSTSGKMINISTGRTWQLPCCRSLTHHSRMLDDGIFIAIDDIGNVRVLYLNDSTKVGNSAMLSHLVTHATAETNIKALSTVGASLDRIAASSTLDQNHLAILYRHIRVPLQLMRKNK